MRSDEEDTSRSVLKSRGARKVVGRTDRVPVADEQEPVAKRKRKFRSEVADLTRFPAMCHLGNVTNAKLPDARKLRKRIQAGSASKLL